jgi:tetratricopeptide (TPR) repeat protein
MVLSLTVLARLGEMSRAIEPWEDQRRPSDRARHRRAYFSHFEEPVMRSIISPFAASAAVALAILTSTGASAETPAEPPICAALSAAEPAKLIELCTALIDNPATPDGDRLDATITRAAALHNSGQTGKALAEIDAVVARDPNRARAFRARGEILRQSGKMEAAFEALNQAIRLEPDNANGYSNRGNAFNNAKKYDRAIEDYNEALRLKPDFAQAFSDRGAAWYFKGDYQKAIADYDEALRLEPHRARTYSNRSAAYRKLGRSERAIEDVTTAIRIDPTQPEFFDNRGLDLAGNGDYARAIADYDEAIKIRPEAKFLTNRGDAYQARKDYDRAIADYDAALKLDPKFQRAYNNRGAAWVKKGDRGRALQDYAEAVRLNPSDATAAANHKDVAQEIERLGSLSYQKNLPSFNCATAKRQVEKAICADPGLAQLDRNINDVFLRAIASAESDSHRAALALTRQQRGFIDKRNASFGKRGYDLRQAMEDRLEKLNMIARQ